MYIVLFLLCTNVVCVHHVDNYIKRTAINIIKRQFNIDI